METRHPSFIQSVGKSQKGSQCVNSTPLRTLYMSTRIPLFTFHENVIMQMVLHDTQNDMRHSHGHTPFGIHQN